MDDRDRTSADHDLISLDDAVREFRIGKSTLFGWITAGKLKRYKRLGDRRSFVSHRALARLTEFREG